MESVGGELVPFLRQPAEVAVDEAGDRAFIIVDRGMPRASATSSSGSRPSASNSRSLTLHQGLLDVILILNLADDLFQNVLDRHQSAVPPYSSTTIAMCIRLRRSSVSRSSMRFDSGTIWAGRSSGDGLHRGSGDVGQEVLRVQDADDLVDRVAVDRQPGVAGLNDPGQDGVTGSFSSTAMISTRGTMMSRARVSSR